ncbi:hypothetical protein PsorP6_012926 [Peronosclerospora sorghi]|uniref:Uncharacterized protein n=1 Tax=Peronosclerospora sorghi TaxID=230839 RepID=A0ACC0WHZ8_9STRA|nr:hypothetical protein PsorP6_012926 [Peronosclerospora sorghi]
MASPVEEAELHPSTETMDEGNEAVSVYDTDKISSEQQNEQRSGREEYLADVERRIEAYENCVTAITAMTTFLKKLRGDLDAMTQAIKQLNAFTCGWLAVWKRPSP